MHLQETQWNRNDSDEKNRRSFFFVILFFCYRLRYIVAFLSLILS